MAIDKPFIRSPKWYGCRPDTLDPRDRVSMATVDELPPSVDLRPLCPPVMDQGALGSCTANAITGALRYNLRFFGKPDVPLSRLQLYYDERAVEGTINEDSGAEIRDGIKCANKSGVAHETLWPYDIGAYTREPPASIYEDAAFFQALTYERVSVDVQSIKTALARKFPVVIGISLFESFESDEVARTGIVPMPNLDSEQLIGGHCMYVVGYGQKPGYFTVRNSWHDDWGDRGDCYIPENYLGSPDYGSDYWIISSIG
jgi:C1A family cysteine protease